MQGGSQTPGPWHVCVRAASGDIVGGGVLIAPDRVLTCVHVVLRALGDPADAEGPPTGGLTFEFPLLPTGSTVQCRAEIEGWFPARDQRGDMAVLKVVSRLPPEARPARLRHPPQLPGEVQVYGHPPKGPGGRWATATAVGPSLRGGERVQLDVAQNSLRITEGYSGCGVLDPRNGDVVGIMVSNDAGSDTVAFMIPVDTAAVYWPLPEPARAEEADGWPDDSVERLTDMLLGLNGIRDPADRGLFVRSIEGEFSVPVPRSADDREDVRSLTRYCLNRPGGMHRLSELLKRRYDPGELYALERFVALMPPPLLTPEERRDLNAMLSRLEPSELPLGRLERSLGPAGSELHGEQNLLVIARHLEDRAHGPDRVPPLLTYLQQVARLRRHQGLHMWVGDLAARLGVGPDRLDASVTDAEALWQEPPQPYVTVELTEDGVDPDLFLVQVSADEDTDPPSREPLFADDFGHPLADLPTRLEQGLSRSPLLRGHAAPRAVEFVLPRRLLSHPVDGWLIGSSNVAHPLGLGYEVVVRSKDRPADFFPMRRWWDKWESVRLHGYLLSDELVEWATRAEAAGGTLLTRLMSESGGTCLVVDHAPADHADPGRDIVRLAWQSGMPIMLWCRDDRDPDGFREEVLRLLESGGVLGLRRHVKELRAAAAADGDSAHLGRHLTLLWDDPNRTLPRDLSLHPVEAQ